MRDRLEKLLKLICLVLIVLTVSRIALELRPSASLADVRVPHLDDLAPPKKEKAKGKSSSSSSSRTRRSSSSRPKLPKEVTARVDAVYKSEIFGPVPRPLPMAVMGLIGEDVILRTPTGQEKLLGVGDEAGGVKILEIGINRILIEQDGKQKELTLHSGYGSKSLLSKEKKQ